MDLSPLTDHLPDFADDLRKNLVNSFNVDHLTDIQKIGSAYAASLACKEPRTISLLFKEVKKYLSEQEIFAAKAAASLMSMNNIYWRFWYLVDDKEYLDIPANISDEIFRKHGINEIDFECFTLSVSAINNCAGCLKVHSRKLLKAGFTKPQVMSVVRIAAVTHSLSVTLSSIVVNKALSI